MDVCIPIPFLIAHFKPLKYFFGVKLTERSSIGVHGYPRSLQSVLSPLFTRNLCPILVKMSVNCPAPIVSVFSSRDVQSGMRQEIFSLKNTIAKSSTEAEIPLAQLCDHLRRLHQSLYVGSLKRAILRNIPESQYAFVYVCKPSSFGPYFCDPLKLTVSCYMWH